MVLLVWEPKVCICLHAFVSKKYIFKRVCLKKYTRANIIHACVFCYTRHPTRRHSCVKKYTQGCISGVMRVYFFTHLLKPFKSLCKILHARVNCWRVCFFTHCVYSFARMCKMVCKSCFLDASVTCVSNTCYASAT